MIDALIKEMNYTHTENNALAYASTLSNLLDFFAIGGAMRNHSSPLEIFSRAYAEDKCLAVRAMFYFRDIRGGQGVRCTFQDQIKYLANIDPDNCRKIIKFIPEYGYWNDIYSLFDTPLEVDVLDLIKNQLDIDIQRYKNNLQISLLAKWLKSENASSKTTKFQAKRIRNYLGLTSENYRKLLSTLRNHINVTERLMSTKQWDKIEYNKIPGKCLTKHKKAWLRNDKIRYVSFMSSAKEGKVTINTTNMYPYEVVDYILYHDISVDEAEAYWKNIRDFGRSDENAIVVADVSGSMAGTPLSVSIGLAIYIAERNTSIYKNKFITFSNIPRIQSVLGDTITEKVNNLNSADWDVNTNIEAVFDIILKSDIDNNIPSEEMIKKIYIISDMEFDEASSEGAIPFEVIQDKYENANYKLPKLVFWNVNAKKTQFPVNKDTPNVQLVSGFSPSILKYLQKDGEFPSPIELMLDVLNSERYVNIL